MDIRKFVANLDVRAGERWRGDCPSCNGKNTLTVTNDMGTLLFNCYKASCKLHGGVNTGMSTDDIRELMRKRIEDDSVVHTTFDIPQNLVRLRNEFTQAITFCDSWDVDLKDVLYDVREDRVVFPVYHDNKIVDAVGRSVRSSTFKWKRYGNAPIPYIKRGTDSRFAVLVEDAISAYHVAKCTGVDGVAILGTSLTLPQRTFISDNYKGVIVALDRDALDKQLAIKNDLSTYVDVVKVIRLNDDFKYREDDDLANLARLIETLEV